jgi:hypothetical protein
MQAGVFFHYAHKGFDMMHKIGMIPTQDDKVKGACGPSGEDQPARVIASTGAGGGAHGPATCQEAANRAIYARFQGLS